MQDLISKTLRWANERNLIDGSDVKSQTLKFITEAGELADNILKKEDVEDSIGDCLVCLIILAEQQGTTLEDCLSLAYMDIKDRQGVMLDGVFIKDTDEAYAGACAVLGARRVQDTGVEMLSKG